MVTAVVQTYNEEKNIDTCLSSLASWTDEIVLVDMHSTDSTVSIAQKYHPKIFSYPYTGFVEPARNFALSKVEKDWILLVDADEEITAKLSRHLVSLAKEGKYDYFRLPRKNIIFGKWVRHSGWWPDYQVRFFRKGSVTWPDEIHGVPYTAGKGMDVKSDEELAIIHHHYSAVSQYIDRLNRYSSVMAKERYARNKKFDTAEIVRAPVREFINRYFVWQGYKDNIHGLALALLQAFSEIVVILKLWEMRGFKEHTVSLEDAGNMMDEAKKELKYWLFTSHLQDLSLPSFKKFIYRIKRKF